MTQGNQLSPTIFNVVVDALVCHWESLPVAKWEGGKSSSEKVDGTQTSRRTIRDLYDRKQWSEEVNQRLTVNAAFLMPTMGWLLPWTQDGFSWR